MRTLMRVLSLVAEVPAALLVVAEIVVLFTGVCARYVFHTPLVWTDELASILFLWLAMLGSVIALQRGEHMRLTAVVRGMTPAGEARTQALASAAVAVTGAVILVAPRLAWLDSAAALLVGLVVVVVAGRLLRDVGRALRTKAPLEIDGD